MDLGARLAVVLDSASPIERRLVELHDLLDHGNQKHGADDPPKHTTDHFIHKAQRHLLKHNLGHLYDAETEKLHLIHAAADLLLAASLIK